MLCYLRIVSEINDIERLKNLFALMQAVITRMQTLGCVGDGAPDVEF